MQEVYEFIKECGVYYLATADLMEEAGATGGAGAASQPRVRPFGTIVFRFVNNKLYHSSKNNGTKNKPIKICKN